MRPGARSRAWVLGLAWLSAVAVTSARAFDGDPREYEATMGSARARLAAGDAAAALGALSEAALRWPDEAAVHLALGLAALRLGRWELAATAYGEALMLNDDSFIARLGLSDARAGLGRWAEAAEAVRPWRETGLAPRPEAERLLRLGVAALGVADLSAAERAYSGALRVLRADATRADASTPASGEDVAACREAAALRELARVGLAAVAARRGATGEARAELAELATSPRPETRSAALRGLAALGPSSGVGGGAAGFAQEDGETHALGFVGVVGARVADHLQLGLRYRRLAGPANASGREPWFGQHEAWLTAAWTTPALDVAVMGAGVVVDARAGTNGGSPQTATRERGGAGGLALRLRAGLDWLGSAAFSATTVETVGQAELGLRVTLGRRASFTAAARGQLSPEGPGLAGRAALRVGDADSFVEGSGLYGRQRRPIELDMVAVYCTVGHLDGRASAVGGVRLGGRFWLTAGYDYEAWRDLDGSARGQHRFGLGLWVTP